LGYNWLKANKVFWSFGDDKDNINGIVVPTHDKRYYGERVRRVQLRECVTVPDDTQMRVPVRLPIKDWYAPQMDWITESREIKPGLLAARMLLSSSDDDAAVVVLNVTGKEQTLRRNIVLGRAKPCPPEEVSPFGMSVSDSDQENSGTFTPAPPVQRCEDTPPQLIDVTAHCGGVTDTSVRRRSENTSAGHVSGSGNEETLHSTSISGSANVVKKRTRFRLLLRPNENFAVSDSIPYIHESVDSVGSAGVETTETDVSHVKPVIDNLPECLTEEEYHTAVDFIERNADVFSRHEYDVGCTNLLTA